MVVPDRRFLDHDRSAHSDHVGAISGPKHLMLPKKSETGAQKPGLSEAAVKAPEGVDYRIRRRPLNTA